MSTTAHVTPIANGTRVTYANAQGMPATGTVVDAVTLHGRHGYVIRTATGGTHITWPGMAEVHAILTTGDVVTFTHQGTLMRGVIVDVAAFNGQVRYGIRVGDGYVYDAWLHIAGVQLITDEDREA